MVDCVITDYLADTNFTENIFLSILYQPTEDDLLDTRFEECIKIYMVKTLPPLIDRMFRHHLASETTRDRPNQQPPADRKVSEWLSSLESPAGPAGVSHESHMHHQDDELDSLPITAPTVKEVEEV